MRKNLPKCIVVTVFISCFSASAIGAEDTIDLPVLARFDQRIDESSGLAIHGEDLWTLNDSGNANAVYRLTLSGKQLAEVTISNATNVDWEALASDENYLYIADTGNNFNRRDSFTIYRVSFEDLSGSEAIAELIEFSYGDYRRGSPFAHNFDAEALTVRGDELWLFTKNRGDGRSNLYRFPKVPGNYSPSSSQSLPVDALVTGGDINPQTGELLLVSTRVENGVRQETVWLAPTTDQGVNWSLMKRRDLTPQDQWEAIVWSTEGQTVYLTHENTARDFGGLSRFARAEFNEN